MRWAKPRIKSPFSGAVSYWLKTTSRNWPSRSFWLAILTAKSTKDSQKSEQHCIFIISKLDLGAIATCSLPRSSPRQNSIGFVKRTEPMLLYLHLWRVSRVSPNIAGWISHPCLTWVTHFCQLISLFLQGSQNPHLISASRKHSIFVGSSSLSISYLLVKLFTPHFCWLCKLLNYLSPMHQTCSFLQLWALGRT